MRFVVVGGGGGRGGKSEDVDVADAITQQEMTECSTPAAAAAVRASDEGPSRLALETVRSPRPTRESPVRRTGLSRALS
jgi:hypothetical protein